MKRFNLSSHFIFALIILLFSCSKDDYNPNDAPAQIIAVNEWIYGNMYAYYLWTDEMPKDINYRQENDPEEYFHKLLYTEKDHWSEITDDYQSLIAEFTGIPLTMGYEPAFYLMGDNVSIFIVVKFVYPGSPAEEAGLQRGDIILTIDNELITVSNYYELFSGTDYSVQLGSITDNTLSLTGESISMTARVMQTNPAIHHEIIETGGHKIGYLVYVQFISDAGNSFLYDLDNIFEGFNTEGVTDVVIDLRYNPGGYSEIAAHLASLIAPSDVVSNEEIFVEYTYNDEVEILVANEDPDYKYQKFINNAHNANLNRIYFLTSSGSASASELLIMGLEPYMDVIQIGEPTFGKYVGSWLIPDDNEEWAMLPIVFKFENSEGFTDFVNGLVPDYYVNDDLLSAVPFGNTSDPMLALAIQLITGTTMDVPAVEDKSYLNFKLVVPEEIEKKSILINSLSPDIPTGNK